MKTITNKLKKIRKEEMLLSSNQKLHYMIGVIDNWGDKFLAYEKNSLFIFWDGQRFWDWFNNKQEEEEENKIEKDEFSLYKYKSGNYYIAFQNKNFPQFEGNIILEKK